MMSLIVCVLFVFVLFGVIHAKKKQPFDDYDITINQNWDYLTKLKSKDGWSVNFGGDKLEQADKCKTPECLDKLLTIEGCYVSFMGGFNAGKTTILNELTEKNFPAAFDASGETSGINFVLYKSQLAAKTIIFADTPGQLRSVKPEELQDRAMTDEFARDLLMDISDTVILVVNILTSQQQVEINKFFKKLTQLSTASNPKHLKIIHNFQQLTSIKSVVQHIKTDVIDAFGGTSPNWDPAKTIHENIKNAKFFEHKVGGFEASHYIYARKNSEAGEHWNDQTTNLLKKGFDAGVCKKQKLNVIKHVMNHLTINLRDYFVVPTAKQVPPNDGAVRVNFMDAMFNALARAFHWVGGNVFFRPADVVPDDLKNMIPQNSKDPFLLTFEQCVCDDGDQMQCDANNHAQCDGRIKLVNDNQLVYCDSRGVGDKPQCRPEINCFNLESDDNWMLQCEISNIDGKFNDDVKDMADKVTFIHDIFESNLYILGTVAKPWHHYLEHDSKLKLIQRDQATYGFVQRVFKLSPVVNAHFEGKKYFKYESGIVTIIVPKKKNSEWWDWNAKPQWVN